MVEITDLGVTAMTEQQYFATFTGIVMFDSSSLYLLHHLKINIDNVSPGSPKTQGTKKGL